MWLPVKLKNPATNTIFKVKSKFDSLSKCGKGVHSDPIWPTAYKEIWKMISPWMAVLSMKLLVDPLWLMHQLSIVPLFLQCWWRTLFAYIICYSNSLYRAAFLHTVRPWLCQLSATSFIGTIALNLKGKCLESNTFATILCKSISCCQSITYCSVLLEFYWFIQIWGMWPCVCVCVCLCMCVCVRACVYMCVWLLYDKLLLSLCWCLCVFGKIAYTVHATGTQHTAQHAHCDMPLQRGGTYQTNTCLPYPHNQSKTLQIIQHPEMFTNKPNWIYIYDILLWC